MTQMGEVPDLSPDPEDVLQVEAPEPVVQVRTVGPVRVQELPRVSAGIRGLTVGTSPRQLLTSDPHRARATILAAGDVLLGGSAQEVAGGQPGLWPAGQVLEFGATDELWAAVATGPDDTQVTVIQERWADG